MLGTVEVRTADLLVLRFQVLTLENVM